VESTVITHPDGIIGDVFAWGLAVDHIFARANDGIATGRATRANTFSFLQKPHAHFESKVRRGECAYRANIDGIKRVIIFERLVRMRRQNSVAAPFGEPKHIVLRDFLTKANTARAKDAALVIQRDPRTNLHPFRFLDFVLEKT